MWSSLDFANNDPLVIHSFPFWSLLIFSQWLSLSLTSKFFDKVLYKCLFSELFSYDFYSSLCNYSSSFLSSRSVAPVVDEHCSLNLLSMVFIQSLLFIKVLLNPTLCPNHSYADDSTPHFITSFTIPYVLYCRNKELKVGPERNMRRWGRTASLLLILPLSYLSIFFGISETKQL